MSSQPCNVCGNSRLDLVDGYYYCSECGTQDKTTLETMMEMPILKEGVKMGSRRHKLWAEKKVQMSAEWKVWHGFNFILLNLADQIIAVGVVPNPESFKKKLLWVWTRYMKKYADIREMNTTSHNKTGHFGEDSSSDSDEDTNEKNPKDRNKDRKLEILNYVHMYSMIFIALNLDGSDIQVADMIRYIREGRLSARRTLKHLPEDLNMKGLPHWKTFLRVKSVSVMKLNECVYLLFVQLDLGSPHIPDMTVLAHRYCKELCLPKDFRRLVISLMELISPKSLPTRFQAIPDYPCMTMGYIVVALKICFGLDDDYDYKLSFAVDDINDEEQHPRAYRVGLSEPTSRLFSFADWLEFLEYRRLILCQVYSPYACKWRAGAEIGLFVDTEHEAPTFREHMWPRRVLLAKMIKEMQLINNYDIPPRDDFPASLTPLTAYTEFVIPRVKNPQIRLLLSEDFTKYSIAYACSDLELKQNVLSRNLVTGVQDTMKIETQTYQKHIIQQYRKPVFVVDTPNDHWLEDYRNSKLNRRAKDLPPLDTFQPKEENKIDEFEGDENIFGLNTETLDKTVNDPDEEEPMDMDIPIEEYLEQTVLEAHHDTFDPHAFNREEIIKTLVLKMCARHKIPVPSIYKNRIVKERVVAPKDKDQVTVQRRKANPITVTDILALYKAKTSEIEENSEPEADVDGAAAESFQEEVEMDNGPQFEDVPMEEDDPQVPNSDDTKNAVEDSEINTKENETVDVTFDNTEDLVFIAKNAKRKKDENFVSDDEIPLAELFKEKINAKKLRSNWKKLINRKKIKSFGYCRFNTSAFAKKVRDFNADNVDYLPSSYRHVLLNCADIIETPVFSLNRTVEIIEKAVYNYLDPPRPSTKVSYGIQDTVAFFRDDSEDNM